MGDLHLRQHTKVYNSHGPMGIDMLWNDSDARPHSRNRTNRFCSPGSNADSVTIQQSRGWIRRA
jgi:hypothetical protein